MADVDLNTTDDLDLDARPPEDTGEVEAPAPEPSVAEAPQPAETPQQPSMVPHAALHQERMRRKALEEKIGEQERLVAKMEERFSQLQEKLAPGPSYDDNPAEYLRAQVEAQRQELESLRGERQTEEQRGAQERQYQEFVGRVSAAEQAFAQQQPDYLETIQRGQAARFQQYLAAGLDAATARQEVLSDTHRAAWYAEERGLDPAQTLYNFARAIAGGASPTEAAQAATGGAGKGGDLHNLERLAQNAGKSTGLGPSGGSTEVSLKALAEADDDEFDKMTEGDNWRKLMTGAGR